MKVQNTSQMIQDDILGKAGNCPKVHKDIVVRDTGGRECDHHYWTGYNYYSYVRSEDGSRDGWPSDVNIVEWRYKDSDL